jgi:hypothetical protein
MNNTPSVVEHIFYPIQNHRRFSFRRQRIQPKKNLMEDRLNIGQQ